MNRVEGPKPIPPKVAPRALSDLTIVIPSHERPRHLLRILNYYRELDVRVLVGDSSAVPFPSSDLPANVTYFHYPTTDRIEKMAWITSKVATDFCLLCGDDDFVVPGAAARCLDFLNRNPAYSSAQGRNVSFRPTGPFTYHSIYLHAIDYAIDGDTPSRRLHEMMELYVQQYYAVQKTATLQDGFGASIGFRNNNFPELILCAFAAMRGKHRVLPILYSARESGVRGPDGEPISQIFNKPAYSGEVIRFSNILADELKRQEAMTAEEGAHVVADALVAYLNFDVDWYTGGYQTVESAKQRWVERRKSKDLSVRIGELNERFDTFVRQGDPNFDQEAERDLMVIAAFVEFSAPGPAGPAPKIADDAKSMEAHDDH